MRIESRSLVVLACSMANLVSCATSHKPVSLAPPERALEAKDYDRELRRWTRFDSHLRQLDTTVRVHATLRSPTFDAAFIAKKKKLFSLDATRVSALEAEAKKRSEETITAIVAAEMHDLSWNDLHRKKSHWRVFLQNDAGQQLDPLKIKKQRRITETDRTLFPHLANFYSLYYVTFPRNLPDGSAFIRNGVKSFSLHIRGAMGSAELRWDLR